MATKKQWSQYLRERKKFERKYAKETVKLEKKLSKLQNGEVTTLDVPPDNPPTKPPNG